jgi:thiamine-monophosphate kinase
VEQALNDGEDFELLFTVSDSQVASLHEQWHSTFPGTPLTRIGELVLRDSTHVPDPIGHGYDHFRIS